MSYGNSLFYKGLFLFSKQVHICIVHLLRLCTIVLKLIRQKQYQHLFYQQVKLIMLGKKIYLFLIFLFIASTDISLTCLICKKRVLREKYIQVIRNNPTSQLLHMISLILVIICSIEASK